MSRACLLLSLCVGSTALSCRAGNGSVGSSGPDDASVATDAFVLETRSGVLFGKGRPAASTTYEHRASNHLQMTVKVEAGPFLSKQTRIDSRETVLREEEIVASDGGAVTRAKVTYRERTSRRTEDEKETTDVPEVPLGVPILLEIKGRTMRVLQENGKPLAKKVSDVVRRDYRSLGRPEPVAEAMPPRVLLFGERVTELDRAVEQDFEQLSAEDGLEVSDVVVVFDRAEGTDGLFDVSLTLTVAQHDDPMKMTVPLKGTMRLSLADSHVTGVDLEGPVAIGVNERVRGADKMKVDGQGYLAIHQTRIVR